MSEAVSKKSFVKKDCPFDDICLKVSDSCCRVVFDDDCNPTFKKNLPAPPWYIVSRRRKMCGINPKREIPV